MACVDVATNKAKPATAINLSIVVLPWRRMHRGGFEPLRLDPESSLADVHQAVPLHVVAFQNASS
jgi:hypothetical protein